MRRNLDRCCWVLCVVILGIVAWTGMSKAHADDEEYYELMRVFVDTFQEIDRNYVKEVDRRQLVEAAVRGMLAELDPYSNYIAPEEVDRFTESISQEFGGVGIRVNFNRQQRVIEVMTPLPGSPAYGAGIESGDRIVEIDGREVKEFPIDREIDEAVKLLRGKPGDPVDVGVKKAGSEETTTLTLVRDIIQLDTVMGYSYAEDGSWNYMYDDEKKVGYLRLTHFTRRSAAEVRQALRSLKKSGMQGLILDLRLNPGGLLQAAVDISDMFVERGKIVSTKGRNTIEKTWPAKRFGTFTGFPMAVLINRYSASASEIVSACLQDHERACVVGERSWGKGSVQNVIEMENGESALKLTTASYHRPSGKNIHRFPDSEESDEWGVMPNDGYEKKFNAQQMIEFQRDRRERDVLGRKDEYESTFEDEQLKLAMEYIEEKLSAPETEPDAAEEDKAEQKPQQAEEKKAAFRLPLVPVENLNIG